MAWQMTNTHFLVISALGADRPGLVDELTRPIEQHGANIIDIAPVIFCRHLSRRG